MNTVVDPAAAPESLRPLVAAADGLDPAFFGHRRVPPASGGRRAAVLMLFTEGGEDVDGNGGPTGPEVLLTERASTLRAHAGQVSFPGGAIDPRDDGPVAAALREAQEETGLDPGGVVPLAVLPELLIPPTGFLVTPVLAHWARPMPVRVVDRGETERVLRIPVAALCDPRNRLTVRGPRGHLGPAFRTAGLLIWGFTAGLLSALLHRSGWERPWDATRTEDVDQAWARARTENADDRRATTGKELS